MKKAPKASKPKPALSASTAHNAQVPEKAIEDIYQKKTQLEHILLRPDTYIGSTEKQEQKLWIHDGVSMQQKEVSFVPGLYKIFDEILVNAADNKVRDPTMDTMKVTIDAVGFPLLWSERSFIHSMAATSFVSIGSPPVNYFPEVPVLFHVGNKQHHSLEQRQGSSC